MTRKELEEKFLKEAEAGGFGYSRDSDGRPYAAGADRTGDLFSMRVVEEKDPCSGGSIYYIDYEAAGLHPDNESGKT